MGCVHTYTRQLEISRDLVLNVFYSLRLFEVDSPHNLAFKKYILLTSALLTPGTRILSAKSLLGGRISGGAFRASCCPEVGKRPETEEYRRQWKTTVLKTLHWYSFKVVTMFLLLLNFPELKLSIRICGGTEKTAYGMRKPYYTLES